MLTVKTENLLTAIKATEKAVLKGRPYKPELESILLECTKKSFVVVGCDAFRAHIVTIEDIEEQPTEWQAIIPECYIKMVLHFLQAVGDESVTIEYKDGVLTIAERTMGNGGTVSIPSVKGEYPDYKSIIPQTDKECLVLKSSLIDTIKSGDAKAADIKKRRVVFAGDTVKIEQSQTHNWNNAETIKEVSVASVLKTKEKIDVILSAQYLYEALGLTPKWAGTSLRWVDGEKEKPVIISPVKFDIMAVIAPHSQK